jgi:CDP-Glycerol:Poly(glycerophosphate) glycerophosphotransferase
MAAMDSRKACALGWTPHYVEHLAFLCRLLDMPMIVGDERSLAAARDWYPPHLEVLVRETELAEALTGTQPLIRDYMGRLAAEGFDVFFYSHMLMREMVEAIIGDSDRRIVQCPHGFSEKRQQWAGHVIDGDAALLYGQLALDQLAEFGVLDRLGPRCLIGAARYHYYIEHREFFDGVVEAKVLGPLGRGRRRILYVPTWSDAIGSSSLTAAFELLIRELPGDSDLVVKLHPHAENPIHRESTEAIARLADRAGNVLLVRDAPLTYPLIAAADAVITDMSSIAYDCLIFDCPIYLFNQNQGKGAVDPAGSRLFQCGTVLGPDQYGHVFRLIDAQRDGDPAFRAERTALFRDLHEPCVPYAELAAAIGALCAGPARLHDNPN